VNNLSFSSFDLIDGIIVFIISEIKFCIDIKYVSKIFAPEDEYSVIKLNKIDNVKLMSNNEMIPLINFHTFYGLTIPRENSNNRLFLLDYENHRIAFLVDRVKEFITINKDVQDSLRFVPVTDKPYLTGRVNYEGETILIPDLDKIISDQKSNRLHSSEYLSKLNKKEKPFR
jgi:chemotaxis signal transduction protein